MSSQPEGRTSAYRYPIKGATREFFCSPLTDEAHEALTAYVRQKFHSEQAQLISALESDRAQEVAIKEIIRQGTALAWHDAVGLRYISTIDGMIRLLYEGCRINEPTLEFTLFKTEILNACASQADAARLARTAFEECNPKAEIPEKAAVAPKRPAQLRRKRKHKQ